MTTPNDPVQVEPRTCWFCSWNGDIGATAHATFIHPTEAWTVVEQMGREFIVPAARQPASPDLHPDDGHEHRYTCVRCGVDQPASPDLRAAISNVENWLEKSLGIPASEVEGWPLIRAALGETPHE
jgi:hypothetical protein